MTKLEAERVEQILRDLTSTLEHAERSEMESEISRLKRQADVLRDTHVQTAHNLACGIYVREYSEKAIAGADKITKGE